MFRVFFEMPATDVITRKGAERWYINFARACGATNKALFGNSQNFKHIVQTANAVYKKDDFGQLLNADKYVNEYKIDPNYNSELYGYKHDVLAADGIADHLIPYTFFVIEKETQEQFRRVYRLMQYRNQFLQPNQRQKRPTTQDWQYANRVADLSGKKQKVALYNEGYLTSWHKFLRAYADKEENKNDFNLNGLGSWTRGARDVYNILKRSRDEGYDGEDDRNAHNIIHDEDYQDIFSDTKKDNKMQMRARKFEDIKLCGAQNYSEGENDNSDDDMGEGDEGSGQEGDAGARRDGEGDEKAKDRQIEEENKEEKEEQIEQKEEQIEQKEEQIEEQISQDVNFPEDDGALAEQMLRGRSRQRSPKSSSRLLGLSPQSRSAVRSRSRSRPRNRENPADILDVRPLRLLTPPEPPIEERNDEQLLTYPNAPDRQENVADILDVSPEEKEAYSQDVEEEDEELQDVDFANTNEQMFEIKKSNLTDAGKGLFARIPLKGGQTTSFYGDQVSYYSVLSLLLHRLDDYLYMDAQNFPPKFYDGAPRLHTRPDYARAAAYANEPKSKKEENASLVIEGAKFSLTLKHDVTGGEEIYVCYGNTYARTYASKCGDNRRLGPRHTDAKRLVSFYEFVDNETQKPSNSRENDVKWLAYCFAIYVADEKLDDLGNNDSIKLQIKNLFDYSNFGYSGPTIRVMNIMKNLYDKFRKDEPPQSHRKRIADFTKSVLTTKKQKEQKGKGEENGRLAAFYQNISERTSKQKTLRYLSRAQEPFFETSSEQPWKKNKYGILAVYE